MQAKINNYPSGMDLNYYGRLNIVMADEHPFSGNHHLAARPENLIEINRAWVR